MPHLACHDSKNRFLKHRPAVVHAYLDGKGHITGFRSVHAPYKKPTKEVGVEIWKIGTLGWIGGAQEKIARHIAHLIWLADQVASTIPILAHPPERQYDSWMQPRRPLWPFHPYETQRHKHKPPCETQRHHRTGGFAKTVAGKLSWAEWLEQAQKYPPLRRSRREQFRTPKHSKLRLLKNPGTHPRVLALSAGALLAP